MECKIKQIRQAILTILVLLFSSYILAQVNIPYNNLCGNEYYRLVWQDEFETLDLTKWKVQDEFDQWGTHFVCIDDNVTVTNGSLKLD